ncbi:MAG: PDZ domain-containing protein, partial [Verrucomicrobiota bacterium]
RGIISAKQRQLRDGANEYFQVDAVINPGNSGGPLINIDGEIIGINVAIFTGQQNVKVWQGIGLSIPANEARAVFEAIVHGKPLYRGFLGLELENIPPRYAQSFGIKGNGVVISDADEGSPAYLSGMRRGDVILNFDGRNGESAEDIIARIRRMKPGESPKIEILRPNQRQTFIFDPIVVSKADTNTLQLQKNISANGEAIAQALGISVSNLTAQQRNAMRIADEVPAIIIADVASGTEAENRFRPGDLIHMINREQVASTKDFYDLLGDLPKSRPSTIILSRRGKTFHAVLNP